MADQRDLAFSDVISIVIIVIMMIIVVALLVASLTGVLTTMIQQPAFIVMKADNISIGGNQAISLDHGQGDAVMINGTTQSGGVSIVSFSLITPSNMAVAVRNSSIIQKSAWRSGDTIYIYYDGQSYWVTDTVPTIVTDLESGIWTVNIIDNKVKGVLHSLSVTV